ncbi:MAG: class I SAM-dependent methyltransferase [Planctomycetota bacterium]
MSEKDDHQLIAAVDTTARRATRLLNIPAGNGRISAALAERGFDVTSADLFPEECTRAPREAIAADMNGALPFEDDTFDGIVSQEGIEHLENLPGFFRECRRILKDGGHLWITTPNFMDMSSRLAFALSGQKSYRAGLPNEQSTVWRQDGERTYHGHAFTLPWFQIRYLLRINQFDDIELRARGWSRSSKVLRLFLRPFIGLVLASGLRRRQRRDRRNGKPAIDDDLRRRLYREGVSKVLLCAKGLAIHARLREGSFPRDGAA